MNLCLKPTWEMPTFLDPNLWKKNANGGEERSHFRRFFGPVSGEIRTAGPGMG